MMRRLLAAATILAALGMSTAVRAQDNWVLIATKPVKTDNRSGTEVIETGDAKGSFKAVRLIAKQNAIELSNVEVVYAGAPSHNERRAIALNVNDRTRPMDAQDKGRFIDRLNLTFKPNSGRDPAIIEVYGLQTSEMARATRSAALSSPTPAPRAQSPAPPEKTALKPGEVNAQGDVLFGTQTVGFGVDRDVIRVGSDIGKFDRVRMRVLDNDIFVRSVKVVYATGESEEATLDTEIKQNTRTRWVQLKGDRFIKEIQLIYNSRPNFRGRAYIEVYGQYAEGWLGPNGEGRKFNQGYVLLGAQTAGFTIDRNDKVEVGPNEGGFRKIRVNVRDEAITLFEVRVIYGNGEVDIIPANRTRIDAGGAYGPIDLKGGSRVIKEVRPTYRTRIFQQGGIARGRAVVEFWGQH